MSARNVSSSRPSLTRAIGVSRRRLLLGPSQEFVERRTERLSPLREMLLDLRRNFSVHNARDDAVSLQLPKLLGQRSVAFRWDAGEATGSCRSHRIRDLTEGGGDHGDGVRHRRWDGADSLTCKQLILLILRGLARRIGRFPTLAHPRSRVNRPGFVGSLVLGRECAVSYSPSVLSEVGATASVHRGHERRSGRSMAWTGSTSGGPRGRSTDNGSEALPHSEGATYKRHCRESVACS